MIARLMIGIGQSRTAGTKNRKFLRNGRPHRISDRSIGCIPIATEIVLSRISPIDAVMRRDDGFSYAGDAR